jgi:DNA mismatch repair protein MutS2
MSGKVPWTAGSGAAFGAEWLLAAIAPSSAFGRRVRARERAFRTGDEAAARIAIARTAAAAEAIDPARLSAIAGILAGAPDPSAAIVRARSGSILGDADFFEISRFLDALGEVAVLARGLALDADYAEPSSTLGDALAPGRTRTRSFYLADTFDAELAAARSASASHQAAYDAARSRLAERASAYAGLERVRDGEFVVMRDRLSAPVPPEIRILCEAPTYVLCELALDDSAVAALAARDAAAMAVASAEESVRARLSELVAREGATLERACDALGEIDALVARARFARRFACVVPEIACDATVAFEDARYLPLASTLENNGRRYTPISLSLDGFGVVTGPNMGGKSAALRTLGFVVACVALGVPVPASAARVPLVDEIAWVGLGIANESDALLSSFGREVVELRAFFSRDAGRALVLVDEFARTTSPREGRALLVALLETLRGRRALGLAATHLAGIAAAANVAHYAIGGLGPLRPVSGAPLDLDGALARIADAMDYGLRQVAESAIAPAGAIALAEALGLDAELVSRAKAVL